MSQARNILTSHLIPFFDERGFRFKQAKTTFIKIENGIYFAFNVRFDGRGGLTMVDGLEWHVSVVEIDKALKKLTNYPHTVQLLFGGCRYLDFATNKITIPVLYSPKVCNLTIKELSKVEFAEKYPLERIKNTADSIKNIFENQAITFFENANSVEKILSKFTDFDNESSPLYLGQTNGSFHYFSVIYLKLLCRKLNLPEPEAIKNQTKYVQDLRESLGHSGNIDSDTLPDKIASYKF